MHRGILAAFFGLLILVVVYYFIGVFDLFFSDADSWKAGNIFSSGSAEGSILMLSTFLIGLCTRAISRKGFFWTLIPLLIHLCALIYYLAKISDRDSEGYGVTIVIGLWFFELLLARLGWWIMKKIQVKKSR